MAVIGVITLLMLAMVMGGGMRVFERFVPESVLVWLDENEGFGAILGMNGAVMQMGGSREPTGEAAKDPAAHLRDSRDGLEGSKKVAPMAQGQVVFVADVLSGRRILSGSQAPAQVGALPVLQGCTFTPPSAAAVVGHVSAYWGSDVKVELATYGDEHLAYAVKQFAKVYRNSGHKQIEGLAGLRFNAFDVVVTETEKPVYLVLTVRSGEFQLWNIHLAPGARLERVVLIGGGQAGVVNLGADVPVEVMRNDVKESCRVPEISYPLNPGNGFYQAIESGRLTEEEADAKLDELAASTAAWSAWFKNSFGVSSDETMAGNWNEGTIAVVGPLPATPEGKAVYAKISGSTARITVNTYVEYPALKAEGGDFASRVVAIATAFAGGNLETLRLEEF